MTCEGDKISAKHAVQVGVETYVKYFFPRGDMRSSISKVVETRDVSMAAWELPERAHAFRFFDARMGPNGRADGYYKNRSGIYYPGGVVYTPEQVKNGECITPDPRDSVSIRKEMEANGWINVVITRMGEVCGFRPGYDQVIDMQATAQSAKRE